MLTVENTTTQGRNDEMGFSGYLVLMVIIMFLLGDFDH